MVNVVQIRKILSISILFGCMVLIGLFVFLSSQTFIADSEFWSISVGYHLIENLKSNWVFTRPLYYFFIWLTQLHYTSPTSSVLWARSLFILNSLVIVFFMVKIVSRRTGSYFYGAVSVLLLFANTGFMNQGFRIRSDLMATSLSLAILSQMPFKKTYYKFLVFVPLLATPKAILHSIVLIFSRSKDLYSGSFRKVVPLIFIVFLVFMLLTDNGVYFLHTLSGDGGGPQYWSVDSFFHIINQFTRNPLFWILVLGRFYTCFAVIRKEGALGGLPDTISDLTRLAFVSFLTMLIFTEKTQFFIASFLPYFSMHAALLFYDLDKLKMKRFANATLLCSVIVCLGSGVFWVRLNESENNNRMQLETLSGVFELLQRSDVTSFEDFTCLLPTYCTHANFVGPNQPAANRLALESFMKSRPDIFFYLKKARFLEPELSNFLSKNYIDSAKGVYFSNRYLSQSGRQRATSIQNQADSSETILGIKEKLPGYLEYLFGYDISF